MTVGVNISNGAPVRYAWHPASPRSSKGVARRVGVNSASSPRRSKLATRPVSPPI